MRYMKKNRRLQLYIILAVLLTVQILAMVSGGLRFSGKKDKESLEPAKEVSQEIGNEPKELYAQSAVLIDADSGRILFGKDEHKVRPMASTTKIMTCILALENMTEGQKAKVSDKAAGQPKVRLGVRSGEEYYIKDLLHSLMLESHNDSAVVIAETIGGSVESFAAMMNERAKELGCTDTHFVTPNGLDREDDGGAHSTTAADLARIMKYCITQSPKKEEFLSITRAKSYEFASIDGKRHFSCNNHNLFLTMMEGALSGKTGFTAKAGYCYVGALRRDDRTFIVALLACGWPNNKTYKWSDARALMNYGLENYHCEDVYEYDREFAPVKVDQAEPENGRLYQEVTIPLNIKEEKIRVLKRTDEEVRTIYEIPERVQAPIKKGQQLGKVTYYLGERQIAQVPVYAAKSAKELKPSWYKEYLLKLFFMEKELNFQEG